MRFIGVFVLATLLKHAGAGCYAGTDYASCNDCGGSCTSENGCLCDDETGTVCIPTNCNIPFGSCCPPGLYWNSSDSCCTDQLICNPPCAGDELCSKLDDEAKCVCNNNLYSNATIKDLEPLLSCDGSTMSTYISQCLLTYLGYDHTNLKLNDNSPNCIHSYPDIKDNKRVLGIQIKLLTGWCGNIATNDSQKVYYTNTLYIGPKEATIITKNPIFYNFTCSYNLTMQTSLNFSLNPLLSVATLTPVSGGGVYTVKMAAYWDASFAAPIQEDETVFVGSDIYLGVIIPDADGDAFTVRVVQCFATPNNDREDANKVQLVSGGCAYDGDVLTDVVRNGVSLEALIKIKAFAFNGLPEVYIFCDVRICEKNEGCTGCKDNRNLRKGPDYASLSINLPLQEDYRLSSSSSQTVLSWGMMAGSLLSFLLFKFF